MPACFYILRLSSGTLYAGATKSLEERYKAHLEGKGCRTTKLDPPVKLIYSEEYDSFSGARKREAQVKRWTRAKKEALASGELTTLKILSKSHRDVKEPALSLPRVSSISLPGDLLTGGY
jgi:putative endonuclease